MMHFYPYVITRMEWLNKQTLAIEIERPEVDFNPGQHVVVRFQLDGLWHYRCLSIASSVFDSPVWRFLIRCKPKGRLATYARALQLGDTISLSAPYGFFYVDVQAKNQATYLLVAADMGMAPLLAMAQSILAGDATSAVHFIYHAMTKDDLILRDELEGLMAKNPSRFYLMYSYEKSPLLQSFSKAKGWKGKLSEEKLRDYIEQQALDAEQVDVFSAGSPEAVDVVRQVFPTGHYQYFHWTNANESTVGTSQAVVQLKNGDQSYTCAPNQNLLDALLSEEYNAPHSCRQGVCGSCAARLVRGDISAGPMHALTEADRQSGYILTCQAYPNSESIEIDFIE